MAAPVARAFYLPSDSTSSDASKIMPELLHHVRIISNELQTKHKSDQQEEHYRSEWRTVALVVDRLLLITFFIITVFTTAVIFMNVPSHHKLADYGST